MFVLSCCRERPQQCILSALLPCAITAAAADAAAAAAAAPARATTAAAAAAAVAAAAAAAAALVAWVYPLRQCLHPLFCNAF